MVRFIESTTKVIFTRRNQKHSQTEVHDSLNIEIESLSSFEIIIFSINKFIKRD